jgi:hypothetical protein
MYLLAPRVGLTAPHIPVSIKRETWILWKCSGGGGFVQEAPPFDGIAIAKSTLNDQATHHQTSRSQVPRFPISAPATTQTYSVIASIRTLTETRHKRDRQDARWLRRHEASPAIGAGAQYANFSELLGSQHGQILNFGLVLSTAFMVCHEQIR